MKRLYIIIFACVMCASVCAQGMEDPNPKPLSLIGQGDVVVAEREDPNPKPLSLIGQGDVEMEEAEASEDKTWLVRVEDFYADHMNYGTITALMTIESSFIPFPSEVVVPPAAFVASQEDSPLNTTGSYPLNVIIIVLFASLGAMLGAIINYGLSIWLGRPIIYKFADSKLGHMLLLSGEKLEKAEAYFNEHGKVSTFVGRLIPGIRQLISIPAGLARMNFGVFLGYTFLGAFIWNCVLALLGYLANGQADLIDKYNHELSLIILGLFGLAVAYLIGKAIVKKVKKN